MPNSSQYLKMYLLKSLQPFQISFHYYLNFLCKRLTTYFNYPEQDHTAVCSRAVILQV